MLLLWPLPSLRRKNDAMLSMLLQAMEPAHLSIPQGATLVCCKSLRASMSRWTTLCSGVRQKQLALVLRRSSRQQGGLTKLQSGTAVTKTIALPGSKEV